MVILIILFCLISLLFYFTTSSPQQHTMPDGGDDRPSAGTTEFGATVATSSSGVSDSGFHVDRDDSVDHDDGVEAGSATRAADKDPRKTARKYVPFHLYASFLFWVFIFIFARNFFLEKLFFFFFFGLHWFLCVWLFPCLAAGKGEENLCGMGSMLLNSISFSEDYNA